jgi:hypothetical protein
MKTTILGMIIILALTASTANAQRVENDDMYFNASDRAKLKELSASQSYASARKTERKDNRNNAGENPTDSYSARTVNPEFSARSNAQSTQDDNQDYFLNNYQYQTAANLNRFNNNFNGWYGNSWYNNSYWSPSIYGWNTPYYGSYYDMWGSPWGNPYYRNSWSSGFSFYWGNSWNYGWGGYNYWNNPWNSWNGGWGSSYAFGNPWGWGWSSPMYGYGYPRHVVVVNNYGEGGRTVSYGKRANRSSSYMTTQQNTRTRTSFTNDSGSGRTNTGGRTGATRQEDYYNKSWRYTTPADAGNSGSTNSNTTTRTRSSNYSNDGSNYNRGSSNSSYSPGRTSSPSYGGGNTNRPSSPAPTGGGSNGRSRGGR